MYTQHSEVKGVVNGVPNLVPMIDGPTVQLLAQNENQQAVFAAPGDLEPSVLPSWQFFATFRQATPTAIAAATEEFAAAAEAQGRPLRLKGGKAPVDA